MATLLFEDTFPGESLDTSKWNVVVNHTMTGMWAPDDFIAEMVAVHDGKLHLSVEKKLVPAGARLYNAGFVFSKKKFNGGYFSARISLPSNAKGMCHAWWLNTSGGYPEIDILENQGIKTIHMTLHELYGAGSAHFGHEVPYPAGSHNFHDWDMWWQPGVAITYYRNGVQIHKQTQGQVVNGQTIQIPSAQMDVKLNTSVGNFGYTNNPVDATTALPSVMVVEHVRVWDTKP